MSGAILFSFKVQYHPNGVVELCALSLINTSTAVIEFTYECKTKNQILCTISSAQILPPNQSIFLHKISWDDFSEKPLFLFSFKRDNILHNKIYKLKPKDIVQCIEGVKTQTLPVFNVPIITNFLSEIKKAASPLPIFQVIKPGPEFFSLRDDLAQVKSVIDLHIGKDVKEEDIKTRHPLEVKMQIFEKYFWKALNHNLPDFTVIHGKGDGILRKTIHEFLVKNRYVKRKEMNHDGGATVIYF